MGSETEFDDIPEIGQRNDGRANQSIIIDTGKHVTTVALCAAFTGLAVAFAAWSAYQSSIAIKESRLTQYYLMDPHSRTPDELAAWSKFNREHEEQ